MIRRPPRSTQSRSSAASDVYKRQRLKRLCRASLISRWRQKRLPCRSDFRTLKVINTSKKSLWIEASVSPVLWPRLHQMRLICQSKWLCKRLSHLSTLTGSNTTLGRYPVSGSDKVGETKFTAETLRMLRTYRERKRNYFNSSLRIFCDPPRLCGERW